MHLRGEIDWNRIFQSGIETAGSVFGPAPAGGGTTQAQIDAAFGVPAPAGYQLQWPAAPDYTPLLLAGGAVLGIVLLMSRRPARRRR